MRTSLVIVGLAALLSLGSSGKEALASSGGKTLVTNQVVMHTPPAWLTERRVQGVVDRVQDFLEWDIRRVNVYWYTDAKAFQQAHGLGPTVLAAARPGDQSVHLGPKVDSGNFDGLFGHELTHVIVFQKYKRAIPPWLEEGLANHVGKFGKIDYAYLASQPFPEDVTGLTHAFRGPVDSRYHYAASSALMEMIADKCSLKDLLQLSVGKNLETYLKTYCEIADLNGAFRQWVKARATAGPPRPEAKGAGASPASARENSEAPWWKKRQEKKHWWQER